MRYNKMINPSSSYTPKPKQRTHSSDGNNNLSTLSANNTAIDGGGGGNRNNNNIIPPPPRPRSSVASSVKSNTSDASTDQRRQDRKVCLLRGGVVITLLTATTLVATFVGLYVSHDERYNFEQQYLDSVSMVAESFQNRIDIKYNTAKTFSAMITSRYGNVAQAVIGEEPLWPNVTIPDFQEQAKAMLTIADGRAISFNPIITQDVNRLEWEAHATATAEILGDPLLVTPDPEAEWPDNRTVSFGIYSRDKDKNVIYDPGYAPNSTFYKDVMVPVWQIAPIENNSKAIMFNLHSETYRQQALDHMMRYQVADLTAFLQLVQDEELRPSAILFYPVFDVFRSKAGDDGSVSQDEAQTVVGSISIVFSWDMLLNDILPNYIKGMICVLRSSTGKSFSYHISGDEVHLMGEGDMHDVKYDSLGRDFEASLLLDEDVDEEINSEIKFIVYTLSIYPSEEFETVYVTNRAAIYASGVVLIFLFTAGLFLLYDYLVEDRQQKTARLAKQRGNIVDSMFPAAFRDRLYKAYGNASDENTSPATPHRDSSASLVGASNPADCEFGTEKSTISGTTYSEGGEHSIVPGSMKRRSTKLNMKKIDKFMKGVRSSMNDENPLLANPSDILLDDPIADLFPDTSIMFSDIVGEIAPCLTVLTFCVLLRIVTYYLTTPMNCHQGSRNGAQSIAHPRCSSFSNKSFGSSTVLQPYIMSSSLGRLEIVTLLLPAYLTP
jgi:hypothetical protein